MSPTRFAEERQRAEAAADVHYGQLMDKASWLNDLPREVKKIVEANASPRSKFAKLRELADRVAAELAPVAACKAGCSYWGFRILLWVAAKSSNPQFQPIMWVGQFRGW